MENIIQNITVMALPLLFAIMLHESAHGRVAVGILPYPLSLYLNRLEPYGMLIILGLIFIIPMLGRQIGMDLNILWYIMRPAINFITGLALPDQ